MTAGKGVGIGPPGAFDQEVQERGNQSVVVYQKKSKIVTCKDAVCPMGGKREEVRGTGGVESAKEGG